ncbi:unnamed protein product, partial [Rotaria magnacalcarata]
FDDISSPSSTRTTTSCASPITTEYSTRTIRHLLLEDQDNLK